MACDTATLAATALQSLRTEFNGASNRRGIDCCFSDDAEVQVIH